MKHIPSAILAAALLAIPIAAQADSSSTTKCDWVSGIMRCQYRIETPRSVTRTLCGFGATSACKTVTVSKEPPRPVLPPSREMSSSGVVLMRGMPTR